MSVRPAKFVDTLRLVELALELHARSVYAPYEATKSVQQEFKSLCVSCIQAHGSTACLFVAERDDVVEGFIMGIADKIYHVLKQRYATDLFFYVQAETSPAHAEQLLEAFEGWAESNPAVVEIRPGYTHAVDDRGGLGALYRRRGYEPYGAIFRRRVQR